MLPRNLPTRLGPGWEVFTSSSAGTERGKCLERLDGEKIRRKNSKWVYWKLGDTQIYCRHSMYGLFTYYLGSLGRKCRSIYHTLHWASGILRCCTEKLKILGYMEILHQSIAEYALFLECHKLSESSAHVYVLDLHTNSLLKMSWSWWWLLLGRATCYWEFTPPKTNECPAKRYYWKLGNTSSKHWIFQGTC